LVKESTAPFRAPPMAASFPGRKAAPPEVNVREPPLLTISCLASAIDQQF